MNNKTYYGETHFVTTYWIENENSGKKNRMNKEGIEKYKGKSRNKRKIQKRNRVKERWKVEEESTKRAMCKKIRLLKELCMWMPSHIGLGSNKGLNNQENKTLVGTNWKWSHIFRKALTYGQGIYSVGSI